MPAFQKILSHQGEFQIRIVLPTNPGVHDRVAVDVPFRQSADKAEPQIKFDFRRYVQIRADGKQMALSGSLTLLSSITVCK